MLDMNHWLVAFTGLYASTHLKKPEEVGQLQITTGDRAVLLHPTESNTKRGRHGRLELDLAFNVRGRLELYLLDTSGLHHSAPG
jgi:hypothetical protein